MKMVKLLTAMLIEREYPGCFKQVGLHLPPQFLSSDKRAVLQLELLTNESLYTRKEVAAIFSVHERTVNRWVQRGWIIRHHLGNHVCYYKGHELWAAYNDRFRLAK